MHSEPDGFCPRCGSTNVRRSHRRGFLERVFLWLRRRRPYRCEACDKRFLLPDSANMGLQRNAPVRTERVNPPAATANPAAAPVNPAGALHAGRERKCSGAKGTPTRRLTVSLPSVCLGAGLPQTPGRGSRPPRALPSQAHNCSYHRAFGCLRIHSARASCNCRLNTSGHFGSRHKLLAALPKPLTERRSFCANGCVVVQVRR